MFPRRSACEVIATPLQSHQERSLFITCKSQSVTRCISAGGFALPKCANARSLPHARMGRGSATVRRKKLAELQSTRDATTCNQQIRLSHPEMVQLELSGAGQRYARPRVSSRVVLATICLPAYLPISTSAAICEAEIDTHIHTHTETLLAADPLPHSRTREQIWAATTLLHHQSNIATIPPKH